ncbi:winged helix-turn-helix transcriptional regulator [Dyadobacter bucti]
MPIYHRSVRVISLPVVTPHVEYSLTNCGRDLEPVISEMFKWSLKYNI